MRPVRQWRVATRVTAVVTAVALWQLATMGEPERGGLPVPGRVLAAFIDLVTSGDLFEALTASLQRVVAGFGIAATVGIPLGLAMGYWRTFELSMNPLVQSFRSVAPIALVPLFLLWFGIGTPAAASVVAWAAVFPLVINTVAGVKGVEVRYVRAARTMGLSSLGILHRVVLPATLPSLFVGARLGLGLAWGSIIAAELAVGARTGTAGGIGQLMYISYAFSVDLNRIGALMVTVGAVGYTMDQGVRWLQRYLTPWSAR
jgi:ABC-type nitrate/sulfonate/bicarbonate transport system permease component